MNSDLIALLGTVFLPVILALLGLVWRNLSSTLKESINQIKAHTKDDQETFEAHRKRFHEMADKFNARFLTEAELAREDRKMFFESVLKLMTAFSEFQIMVERRFYSKDDLQRVLAQIQQEQVMQNAKLDRMVADRSARVA